MKFGHTEIYVSKPLEAMKFYKDILGFEVDTIQQEKYVWLKKANHVVLLKPGRKAEFPTSYQEAASGIVFYTDDLEKTSSDLKSKGLEFKGTDGSESCLTFTDPDGNWFQLVNPNAH